MLIDYRLIDMEERHLELVLQWRRSKVIRAASYSGHFLTRAEHVAWFENTSKDPYTIVKLLEYQNEPLGLVNFSNLDAVNERCQWGIYIGAKDAPRGSGTILGALALNMIFYSIGMHKVCAEVIDDNPISLNFHRKLGFIEEGRFQKHIKKNNQFIDVIPMALFSKDWKRDSSTLFQ